MTLLDVPTVMVCSYMLNMLVHMPKNTAAAITKIIRKAATVTKAIQTVPHPVNCEEGSSA